MLQYSYSGTKNYVKHLLIDEMQDYSPIQYKVMQKLFPCRKTVLGDASQSVNPYGSSTADMIQKALVTGEVMKPVLPGAITASQRLSRTNEVATTTDASFFLRNA